MNSLLENRNDFLKYLYSFEDLAYRDFHKKIIMSDNVIGIRSDTIKKISKELSKYNFEKLFSFDLYYHEEKMILGYCIVYCKKEFDEKLKLTLDFLRYIDNWAICDSFSCAFKDFFKNKEKGFDFILSLIDRKEEYAVRLGFVLLLCYYVNDLYIDRVIDIIIKYEEDNINNDIYYIDMAISWLISAIYVKYKDKVISLFESPIRKFVRNKAISKICDSYRVGKEEKEFIKKYRVK